MLTKIVFDVGRTIHGQQVNLTRETNATGQATWTLGRCPANQQDNSEQVHNLSEENILRMAAAVDQLKKAGLR